MCTALYQREQGLFGRTLDLEYTYHEQVVITPRERLGNRYALLGTATLAGDYPLYYDGLNEVGLAIAGLNFPHSAYFPTAREGSLAVHELIPTLLGQCTTVEEAITLLQKRPLGDRPFSPDYPTATLHWMLADKTRSVVIESTVGGVQVYDNPVGVMTNEPPFPKQLKHWAEYAHLSHREPTVTPPELGRGSGCLGLPGDYTSPSRFVRAAFGVAGSLPGEHPVGQFFHLMSTVEVPRGAVCLPDGRPVVSHYTCSMDLKGGVYYYRTYGSPSLRAVTFRPEGLIGQRLMCYPHQTNPDVTWEN